MASIYGAPSTDRLYLDFRREVSGGSNTDNISGGARGITTVDGNIRHHISPHFLDSPAQSAGTTITYKLLFSNHAGSVSVSVGESNLAENGITLFEIAG